MKLRKGGYVAGNAASWEQFCNGGVYPWNRMTLSRLVFMGTNAIHMTRRRTWLTMGLIIIALASGVFFLLNAADSSWIRDLWMLGRSSPELYGLVVLVAALFFLPIFPLGVVAGMIFGIGTGYIVMLPGVLVGAYIAGWLGNTWLRTPTRRWMRRHHQGERLDTAFAQQGIRFVVLVRLVPVLPFSVQNYVCGALGVRPRDVLTGTLLGVQPALITALYLGHLITDFSQLREEIMRSPFSGLRLVLLIAGLIALIILGLWLKHVIQKTSIGTSDVENLSEVHDPQDKDLESSSHDRT